MVGMPGFLARFFTRFLVRFLARFLTRVLWIRKYSVQFYWDGEIQCTVLLGQKIQCTVLLGQKIQGRELYLIAQRAVRWAGSESAEGPWVDE